MKFSTKSEYGLRALVNLAKNQDSGPYSLTKIAQAEKISLAYLERLFARLKKAKIVQSVKGVNGGYQLGRPAENITIKEVFTALEGSLAPYLCVGIGSLCEKNNSLCKTKVVWQKLAKGTAEILDSIKLSELIK